MSDTPQPPPEEQTERLSPRGPLEPARLEPPRSQPLPTPGQRLAERYTVLQVVGEGGMGVVLAAYDERLDRRVALKLLRRDQAESSELEARLVREGQAMARLNHPNVVAVYDSGRLEEGTFFIAMEYVEGKTLQEWSQQQPRPWREVLGAYLQAGRGLAAAHAVGLIHRDFKPANVLVGHDGRVRVTDFGVARVEASHSLRTPSTRTEAALPVEAWVTPLTLPGNVVGTPRYMAPELLKGRPADVRSDVFALCVALYEALSGQPAFAGETVAERIRAQVEGRLTPPPARTEVPAWVWRVVAQGLSAAPEQRPASLHALLALLEDDPEARRRERWRRAALASAAVALVGLGAWGWVRGQGPGCSAMERRLEGVWDAPLRAQVRGALVGTGLSFAADTAQRVEAALDGYASAWVQMSQQVCEAGSRAEQVRGLGVLREACLERRRSQLRALTELLAKAPDKELVPKAMQAVQALPPLEYCADEKALTAAVPPPEDKVLRARVEQLQQRVDWLEALYEAGKYAQGLAEADKVLTEVEGVDFAPLRARALFQVAQLRDGAGEYKSAEERVRQAIPLAAQGGDALVLARAWSLLTLLVGERQSRHQEALGTELALETVVELARDDRVRALSLNSLGSVLFRMGRYEEALARHGRALRLREKALGPEHPQVASSLNSLGSVLYDMGRYEEALAHYERALALQEKALGPEHPSVATLINNQANVLADLGKYEEALAHYERALALWEKALGPEHPSVASSLNNLGQLLRDMGRYEEALARHGRALVLQEKVLRPGHPSVASSLNNLGLVLYVMGRYEEALAHYERALALREKALGPEHLHVAIMHNNLGLVLQAQGRYEEAQARHERALRLREKVLGAEHPNVAGSLNNLGSVLHDKGRYEEALAHYERALALQEKVLGPEHPSVAEPLLGLGRLRLAQRRPAQATPLLERALALAQAKDKPAVQLALARALWDSGENRRRAVELATQAHAQWRAHKHPQQTEAAQWLASHLPL